MKAKLVELILRGVSFLSIPTQRRLGDWLGLHFYKKRGRDYKITIKNIRACFPQMPEQEQETLALQSLQATATVILETPAVWFRGEKWQNRDVIKIENQPLFDAALSSGHGIILLVPHFGNWELTGQWAAARRPVTALYRSPRMSSLDPLLRKVREKDGANTTVPASPRGVMAVIKALKLGGMTLILPDQQPDISGGIFSPYFGQSALTITLINRLIAKTDPVVLIAYARRVEKGHVVGFLEPDKEIYSEDPQTSVDAMNRSIEELVNTAPAQYQWEYKRFRQQSGGGSDFYS